MPVIYKAEDHTFCMNLLIKDNATAMSEQGELIAIVYAPEHRDSQGDIASAEVIKQMAYDSAKEGVRLDIRHDGKVLTKDQAFVAENFIVQKNDPRFAGIKDYNGTIVDPTGAWGIVLKVDDAELRKSYREGGWNGVSLQGTAEAEVEKEDNQNPVLTQVIDIFAKRLGIGDTDMTPTELNAALEKSNKTLAESIGTAFKEAIRPLLPAENATPPATGTPPVPAVKKEGPQPPLFAGSPLDSEAVMQHQRNLALFSIRKDVDWNDINSLMAYQQKMAAFEQQYGLTKEDQEYIETAGGATGTGLHFPGLKKAAHSSMPVEDSDPSGNAAPRKGGNVVFNGGFEGIDMSKEDKQAAQIGISMGKFINQQRGMVPLNN